MKLLEDRIIKDGEIYPGDVLKIDNFLNHQIDVPFINELGKEFYRLFKDEKINKILTIEASGISIATLTALNFGVPVVFAKKSTTSNIGKDLYVSSVYSYTHQSVSNVLVSKKFLSPDDRILIIDDFLANGNALNALIDIIGQSGATLVGCGIVVEKAYQDGGDLIRGRGIRVESLARVALMSVEDGFKFIE